MTRTRFSMLPYHRSSQRAKLSKRHPICAWNGRTRQAKYLARERRMNSAPSPVLSVRFIFTALSRVFICETDKIQVS